MEARFGHDFGRVRVHDDAAADSATRRVRAQAFTFGEHVFFRAGRYRPSTVAGRQLLSHELMHVMQQARRRPTVQRSPDDPTAAGALAGADFMIAAPWQGSYERTVRWLLQRIVSNAEERERLVEHVISATRALVEGGGGGGLFKGEQRGKRIEDLEAEFEPGDLFGFFSPIPEILAEEMGIPVEALVALAPEPTGGAPLEALDVAVFADAARADLYLDLIAHFTGRRAEPWRSMAGDGLDLQELESIADTPKARILTRLISQGWREYAAAGGRDLSRWAILQEVVLEQFSWGNPTALRNLLRIGEGTDRGRENQLGIVHRATGELLYDASGAPILSDVGLMLRDRGHVASERLTTGDVGAEFAERIEATERGEETGGGAPPGTGIDPATALLLEVLGRTIADPALVIEAAARNYFQNVEQVNPRIVAAVEKEIAGLASLPALAAFAGFLSGHGLARWLIRSAHPPLVAAGAALEGLLRGVGWLLDIEAGVGALGLLMNAAHHLARIRADAAGNLTSLSERHLDEAAQPVAKMIVDIATTIGPHMFGKILGAAIGRKMPMKIQCSECSMRPRGADVEKAILEQSKSEWDDIVRRQEQAGRLVTSFALHKRHLRTVARLLKEKGVELAGTPAGDLLRHIDESVADENVFDFVRRHADLLAEFEALKLLAESDPDVFRLLNKALPDWQKPSRGAAGTVGRREIDMMEVFLDDGYLVVTDITLAWNSRLHNFKTLFYKRVIQAMVGSGGPEVVALDIDPTPDGTNRLKARLMGPGD